MKIKASETKRQHYVPQTYLKHFSLKQNKEYFIHALSKHSCDEKQIKEFNIKNICVENNIYTLPFENVKERMLLEQFFSNEVESNYDKVYNLLTDTKQTTITETERAMIITTVLTMFVRTTFWKNQINSFKKDVFEKAYLTCKQYNKDYFYYGKDKMSIKDKTLGELQNEYKIKNSIQFLLILLNAAANLFDVRFQNDDICVISIDDENEFITSDNPVIAFNNGTVIPVNPENTMLLPIDKKHILWLLPNDNKIGRLSIFRRKIKNNEEVKEYNSMQKQCCERFLLGTKSALINLL